MRCFEHFAANAVGRSLPNGEAKVAACSEMHPVAASSNLAVQLLSSFMGSVPTLAWRPPPPPPPEKVALVFARAIQRNWPGIVILGLLFGAILWQIGERKAANKPSKGRDSGPAVPEPKKEKDFVDPSLPILLHAYSGYAYLIMRGYFLDFLQILVGTLFFWRSFGMTGGKLTSPPLAAKAGPPFNSGWVIFYTRRLYSRIQDCWNRPIAGEAATSLDVIIRHKQSSGDAAPLVPTGEKRRCLNLGSYNYLGFGGLDETCTPAVIEALRTYGVSACSSRLEAGHVPVHSELESTVARFLGKESALVIGMGFATNSTIIPVLVDPEGNGKGVLLLSDTLNHSSIVEGVRGSGAKVVPFAHNNMHHLEAILRRATDDGQASGVPWRKIIILVEGIYSMEGQFSRLREIVALKKKYRAYLYLDEAHSIGAVGPGGRGITDLFGIPTADVDIMMGTFTKSFGSIGGYLAADAHVISALRRHSASSLYAAAMSPPAAQQVLSALKMIMGEDPASGDRGTKRMAQLVRNSNKFREGLIRMGGRVLGDRDSPVIPMMLYHPEKIYNFSQACLRRHLAVVVVGYPATPLLLSRVRFCIAASHTEAELEEALVKIEAAAKEVGVLYDKGTETALSPDPDAVAKAHMAQLKAAPLDAGVATAWTPEPLVQPSPPGREEPEATYQLALQTALTVAKGQPPLELRTTDFLRMTSAEATRAAAEAALRKYGCGTCGPRGFYGTLDVHLELESALASFLQTEAAIIYSYGIATPSSVIPAFVRAGDVLFVDEAIHFTTAVGVKLARGAPRYFAHNDMVQLEAMLAAQAQADRALPAAKRPRRFLLAEGLYANGGGLCNLPELLRLRDTFGCYLIVDETLSIGALGLTGRGIAEHFGRAPCEIDIIIGSMEHALGSVGGFCAGSAMIVSHQRLSGTGYCFSASLPAFATCAALAALKLIDDEPQRLAQLREATAELGSTLTTHLGGLKHVSIDAHEASPLAHVGLSAGARQVLSVRQQEQLLRAVALATARARDGAAVQLMVHSGLAHIQTPRPPTIRLAVHSGVVPSAMDAALKALATALGAELKKHERSLALATTPSSSDSRVHDDDDHDVARTKAANKKQAAGSASSDGGAGVEPNALAGAGVGAASSASPALPTEAAPPVTIPVLYTIEFIRQVARRYVLRQMEWHAFWLGPQLARLRAARNPTLHAIFTVGHFCGSEAFYLLAIPVLCWSLGQRAHMNMFVAYFALNMYAGNWLKNFFALGRPEGAEGSPQRAMSLLAMSDYGWPSMYAVNAVGLPFFALRYWFGGFGQGTLYSAENEFTTAASYTMGIIWVLTVCGARLYSGASSPADVQGGMLVGGVLVRVWLPVCEDVDRLLSSSATIFGLPQPTFLLLLAVLLLLVHPFTPNDPRAWAALETSTKAVAFTTWYIIGANYCSTQPACAAFEPPPVATLGLAPAALQMVVRSVLGFALLLGASYGAQALTGLADPWLRFALPNKPCVPRLARSGAVFTASGLMVSLVVPTALAASGL